MLRNCKMFEFRVEYDYSHYSDSVMGGIIHNTGHQTLNRKVVALDYETALAHINREFKYSGTNLTVALLGEEPAPHIIHEIAW
jgi:hypothetical protein